MSLDSGLLWASSQSDKAKCSKMQNDTSGVAQRPAKKKEAVGQLLGAVQVGSFIDSR